MHPQYSIHNNKLFRKNTNCALLSFFRIEMTSDPSNLNREYGLSGKSQQCKNFVFSKYFITLLGKLPEPKLYHCSENRFVWRNSMDSAL